LRLLTRGAIDLIGNSCTKGSDLLGVNMSIIASPYKVGQLAQFGRVLKPFYQICCYFDIGSGHVSDNNHSVGRGNWPSGRSTQGLHACDVDSISLYIYYRVGFKGTHQDLLKGLDFLRAHGSLAFTIQLQSYYHSPLPEDISIAI